VVDWPLSYVYWAILAGIVLTTLRLAETAWRGLRQAGAA
jgi:TRAP-type C4-dicarboxylate transport system permease small subunit